MAKFRITDRETGRAVTVSGDSPPTDADAEEIFRNAGLRGGPAPSRPEVPQSLMVSSPARQWSNIGAESMGTAGIRDYIPPGTVKMMGRAASAVPFNLGDEAIAGTQSLGGADYGKSLARVRDIASRYQEERPVESFGIGLPANIAAGMMLPAAKTVLGAALQGGSLGGITGFGAGEGFEDRFNKAVPAAISGATMSAILKGAENYVTRKTTPPEQTGRDFVQSLVDRSGKSVDDLEQAGAAPLTSAEAIGNRGQTHLMAMARRSGTTGDDLSARMLERGDARVERIFDALQDASGVNPEAAKGNLDALVSSGKAKAAPIFRTAFKGGSTAPLQKQLEQEFALAGRAEAEALKELSSAEQGALVSSAAQSRAANNVYANSSANSMAREAQSAIDDAAEKLSVAQADKASILDMLRKSQGDAASGVKGAVWNPRIERILSDPIAKAGLARGIEVQRLESVKNYTKFDPTELAIKGTDQSGLPIIDKVPNMRTLHAVKVGLDEIINDAKDVAGRIQWNDRLYQIDGIRRNLVNELRSANPDYAAALNVSGDYLSASSAFSGAQKMLLNNNVTEKQFGEFIAKLPPADREAAKGGIANKLFDLSRNNQLSPKKFLTPKVQGKLTAALGDKEAEKFIGLLEKENLMKAFETRAKAVAGSQTMPLAEAAREQDAFGAGAAMDAPAYKAGVGRTLGSVFGSGAGAAVGGAVGGPAGSAIGAAVGGAAGRNAGSLGSGIMDRLRTSGLSEQARNEAGRALMLSPQELADLLRQARMGTSRTGTVITNLLRAARPGLAVTYPLLAARQSASE